MKRVVTILSLVILFNDYVRAGNKHAADVYIIYYATAEGKTGHVGVAMDTYKIIYKEQAGALISDTVNTGELVYYDLWPNEDNFSVKKTGKNIPAVYFKLPMSSTDEITVNTLYDMGIPHREHYPCDGMLQIETSWEQDQWMIHFLDSTITANRDFNAKKFNCADFVRIPVEKLLDTRLRSREFIGTGWSTTPNKLYQQLRKLDNVKVIKNADEKATGSFLGQRVVYSIFHKTRKKGF
ncbi:MAG: hypothetical protein ABIR18_03355 [Chitinophagaceae bacterium]